MGAFYEALDYCVSEHFRDGQYLQTIQKKKVFLEKKSKRSFKSHETAVLDQFLYHDYISFAFWFCLLLYTYSSWFM